MIDIADDIKRESYPLSSAIPNTCRQIHTNTPQGCQGKFG